MKQSNIIISSFPFEFLVKTLKLFTSSTVPVDRMANWNHHNDSDKQCCRPLTHMTIALAHQIVSERWADHRSLTEQTWTISNYACLFFLKSSTKYQRVFDFDLPSNIYTNFLYYYYNEIPVFNEHISMFHFKGCRHGRFDSTLPFNSILMLGWKI